MGFPTDSRTCEVDVAVGVDAAIEGAAAMIPLALKLRLTRNEQRTTRVRPIQAFVRKRASSGYPARPPYPEIGIGNQDLEETSVVCALSHMFCSSVE